MITKGALVLYVLSAQDAEEINRRRTDGASIGQRLKVETSVEVMVPAGAEPQRGIISAWPYGAQAHIGNFVRSGQAFPGIVVEDWQAESNGAGVDVRGVNLQVWLDGNDTFWATSRHEDASKSPGPGTWSRLSR